MVVRDAAPTRTQVEATFAEADRRAALRRQHDIKSTITGYELLTNPFQYQDPVMIFEGAGFRRMMSSSADLFVAGRDQEIYVSRLPSNLFSRPNELIPLVVRVRGLMEGTNGLGARIQVPHVEYVSVWGE